MNNHNSLSLILISTPSSVVQSSSSYNPSGCLNPPLALLLLLLFMYPSYVKIMIIIIRIKVLRENKIQTRVRTHPRKYRMIATRRRHLYEHRWKKIQ